MEGSLGGEDYGEDNGVDFVNISEIFVTQDSFFFFGSVPFGFYKTKSRTIPIGGRN